MIGTTIEWIYLVVQFLPGSISPIAKFGRFRTSSDDPIGDLKIHLGRYLTYMPNVRFALFRVNGEGENASDAESVLKLVYKLLIIYQNLTIY